MRTNSIIHNETLETAIKLPRQFPCVKEKGELWYSLQLFNSLIVLILLLFDQVWNLHYSEKQCHLAVLYI